MKVRLFTHTDLDGVASTIVLHLKKNVSQLSVEYSEPTNIDSKVISFLNFLKSDDSNLENYDRVFITDLFVSVETAKIIDEFNKEYRLKTGKESVTFIQLYDHHVTGAYLNEYEFAVVKDIMPSDYGNFDGTKKECASHLFFSELPSRDPEFIEYKSGYGHPDTMYMRLANFLNLVRLWDTWEWKDVEIRNAETQALRDLYQSDTITFNKSQTAYDLNQLFMITPKKDFIDSVLNFVSSKKPLLSDEEKQRIKYANMDKNNYINRKIKSVNIITIGEYSYGIVFAEKFISELGNKICNIPNIDIGAIIIPDLNQVSLRTSSESNIDLSKIAKSFGGGGHEKASGFRYDIQLTHNFIKNIFKCGGENSYGSEIIKSQC